MQPPFMMLEAAEKKDGIGEYRFYIDGIETEAEEKGDRWVVTIPNIAAKDLDTMHTVKAIRGDEELTVTISGLSYGYTVLNRNLLTEDWRNTMRALYLYNQAANTYFNS